MTVSKLLQWRQVRTVFSDSYVMVTAGDASPTWCVRQAMPALQGNLKMRESIKQENGKTGAKRNDIAGMRADAKSKGASACGACNACRSLGSPVSSSESARTAISHAKAAGKESCAVSFMQKTHGNRLTARICRVGIAHQQG